MNGLMRKRYDQALAPIANLVGYPVQLQTDSAKPWGFRPGPLDCKLFHWFDDVRQRRWVEQEYFECYLENSPDLFREGRWQNPALLPFGTVESTLVMFVDIAEPTTPVKVWSKTGLAEFETAAPSVQALRLYTVRPTEPARWSGDWVFG